MRVGAHVSVAKGYIEALEYARSVGCECFQFFAKSPRQWRGPGVSGPAAEAFIEARDRAGFGPVFSHTAYLINLSTDNDELRAKSIVALADELVRGATLGVRGVVTHVGNDPSGDRHAAMARAADSVRAAFEVAGDAAQGARLLLENTAGAGSTFGGPLEELAGVIELSGMPAEMLGVCLDTCHAFAFGYALDCEAGWAEVAQVVESAIGAERMGLVHANDCMFERGSRRDRHAWIGDGFIGYEGFRAMMCTPVMSECCAITEMPGEAPQKDETNVARLAVLREECRSAQ